MKILTKNSDFRRCSLWKTDNNVEVINVDYDKWILKASEGSLGLCRREKPLRQLAVGRGSCGALSAERGC